MQPRTARTGRGSGSVSVMSSTSEQSDPLVESTSRSRSSHPRVDRRSDRDPGATQPASNAASMKPSPGMELDDITTSDWPAPATPVPRHSGSRMTRSPGVADTHVEEVPVVGRRNRQLLIRLFTVREPGGADVPTPPRLTEDSARTGTLASRASSSSVGVKGYRLPGTGMRHTETLSSRDVARHPPSAEPRRQRPPLRPRRHRRSQVSSPQSGSSQMRV